MSDNMFERAVKNKYRYPTNSGLITTEDLYDLPLKARNGMDLDTVAKNINRQLKQTEEESFVEEKSSSNTLLQNKLDIVKHVIACKKADQDRAEKRAVKAEERRKLLDAISRKKDQQLEAADLEDLQKKLEALDEE